MVRFGTCCLLWLIALTVCRCALGQTPTVTQAPLAVQFSEWQKVAATADAIEYSVTFPTPLPSGIPVNDVVPLTVFMPAIPNGKVPGVLILHYWGATDLNLERALSLELAKHGIGAAVLVLPYHLGRTPPGYRSGALAIQADPARLVTTMTQSNMDVRRAVDFLQSRPEFDGRFGITGISLGALVAALSYGIEPRFQSATLMLGGVNLAHVIWKSSRVVSQREVLRANGYTEALLRDQLQSIEPATYLRARTTGSAFVIGAKYDTVIPRASTDELISDLHNVKTLWLDTGHYGGVFVQHRLLHEVARFFEGEFNGMPYTPPSKLATPTIRLGAGLTSGGGFDINVGFDLLRPAGTKSPFASFLLSPRGGRVFVGQGVDRNVSLGIVLTSKRTGFGALWSTVL